MLEMKEHSMSNTKCSPLEALNTQHIIGWYSLEIESLPFVSDKMS